MMMYARLKRAIYAISDYGWGPKSEVLPGAHAAIARTLHTAMWWVFVWPREWAARDMRRWLRNW